MDEEYAALDNATMDGESTSTSETTPLDNTGKTGASNGSMALDKDEIDAGLALAGLNQQSTANNGSNLNSDDSSEASSYYGPQNGDEDDKEDSLAAADIGTVYSNDGSKLKIVTKSTKKTKTPDKNNDSTIEEVETMALEDGTDKDPQSRNSDTAPPKKASPNNQQFVDSGLENNSARGQIAGGMVGLGDIGGRAPLGPTGRRYTGQGFDGGQQGGQQGGFQSGFDAGHQGGFQGGYGRGQDGFQGGFGFGQGMYSFSRHAAGHWQQPMAPPRTPHTPRTRTDALEPEGDSILEKSLREKALREKAEENKAMALREKRKMSTSPDKSPDEKASSVPALSEKVKPAAVAAAKAHSKPPPAAAAAAKATKPALETKVSGSVPSKLEKLVRIARGKWNPLIVGSPKLPKVPDNYEEIWKLIPKTKPEDSYSKAVDARGKFVCRHIAKDMLEKLNGWVSQGEFYKDLVSIVDKAGIAMGVEFVKANCFTTCILQNTGGKVSDWANVSITSRSNSLCSATFSQATTITVKESNFLRNVIVCKKHVFTVKTSDIEGAGFGLFAATDFPKGALIGMYCALPLGENDPTNKVITVDVNGDSYVYQPAENEMYMGLHFANHIEGSKANAHVKNDLLVYACKAIKAGTEIVWDYKPTIVRAAKAKGKEGKKKSRTDNADDANDYDFYDL